MKDDIKIVEDAGVTRLHLDVMDGHFVPNLTFGPFIINDISKITNSHLETHLMIENPHQYFDDYINAGTNTLIFHYEASKNINKDLKYSQEKIEEIETSKGDYITHEKFEAHTYKCISETGSLMVFTKGVRGGKFYEDDTFRLEKKLI